MQCNRILVRWCSRPRWLCVAVGVACVLALPGFALVREVPFSRNAPSHYELSGEPLSAFLERFFADNGLRVVMSKALQEDARTLNGIRDGKPSIILASIINSNNLVSFYDGNLVHVALAAESVHRVLAVPSGRSRVLRASLQRLQLADRQNHWQVNDRDGILEVGGHPRFVDQVLQWASALSAKDDPEMVMFQYFPLQHAWASDRVFSIGGREVTVTGIANILRDLVQERAGKSSQQTLDIALPATAVALKGKGLAAQGRNVSPVPPPVPGRPLANTDVINLESPVGETGTANVISSVPLDSAGFGRIVADPQRNAVIVRDIKARMPMYENLIRQLDVPVQIVEIEATIIDVDTDRLREIGVDWRYASDRRELMFGGEGSKQEFLAAIAGETVDRLAHLPGVQVGAIIGDRNRFATRLSMLEQEGLVKVSSRPKVVTLNDLEAVIENSRSIYIPVKGAYEVDLFKVFAGTVLRVTPHVIETEGKVRIRMNISAEDGVIEDVPGASSPTVTRNALSTQALIGAGSSLLLGGMEREVDVTRTRKFPWLGDLPWIGRLFRFESRSLQRSERLFLISPRLLSPDGESTAEKVPVDIAVAE